MTYHVSHWVSDQQGVCTKPGNKIHVIFISLNEYEHVFDQGQDEHTQVLIGYPKMTCLNDYFIVYIKKIIINICV